MLPRSIALLAGAALLSLTSVPVRADEITPPDRNGQLLSRSEYYRAWIEIGDEQVVEGDYSEALEAYDQAIAVHPTRPDAWESLGDAHLERGDYSEAIAAYNEATHYSDRDARLEAKIRETRSRLDGVYKNQ